MTSRGLLGGFLLLSSLATFATADLRQVPVSLPTRWSKEVSKELPLPEYPRPQMVRKEWLNLNGPWELAFARPDEEPPVGETLPEKILVPFPVESALSGVTKRAKRLWYRRTFSIPEGWAGKRILLHFGAVDWRAEVFVNGSTIGQHSGGYDPFSFDITAALKPKTQQELIVGVFDPSDAGDQPRGKQVNKPGGIYYTPSTGIWQTVWLEPVATSSISKLKITPDVDSSRVVIVPTVTNSEGISVKVIARTNGKEIASTTGKPGEALALSIPDPKLWSPDSPFLYDLEVVCTKEEQVLDQVESYFGMRKVSLGKDDAGITRILLNDKFFFQMGPLDQGYWPDGLYTAPTDEALRFDLEMTKKLGFNMTRKHVKVEPARWYTWCDKMGLLVWQDMPSGDNKSPESRQQFESELLAMIDTLESHPSIILWVVFNEGWGQFDTERMTEVTKRRDPSRLVTNASGWFDKKVGDVIDMHVYPGPGAFNPEESRASVLGEYGGLGLRVDGHTWTRSIWGYQGTGSPAELTRRYEAMMRNVVKLKVKPGLSAAIYTQITDVESECNGLFTYDREVLKVNLDRIADANRGQVRPAPKVEELLPTARQAPAEWRYTTSLPSHDWMKESFADSAWKLGKAGFGTEGTPGSTIGTVWNTPDIWLRREFSVKDPAQETWQLYGHHDEDIEIYINGVLAARVDGYTTDYELLSIGKEALATLKPGKNTIAVHCHQTGGGQYIDVGIVNVIE